MKKLLTTLTILALISPMPLTAVDAQAADPGITPGTQTKTTQASVTISEDIGTYSIKVIGDIVFQPFNLEFGKPRYDIDPLTEDESVELTVTDTRFGDAKYFISAELSGREDGENIKPFPNNTELKLIKSDIKPTNSDLLDSYTSEPHAEQSLTLKIGSGQLQQVMSAVRTNNFQGAGEWIVTYRADKLSVPHHEDLAPNVELGGTITWHMNNGSH